MLLVQTIYLHTCTEIDRAVYLTKKSHTPVSFSVKGVSWCNFISLPLITMFTIFLTKRIFYLSYNIIVLNNLLSPIINCNVNLDCEATDHS